MKVVEVEFTDGEYDELKAESDQQGISVAELLQERIERYVAGLPTASS